MTNDDAQLEAPTGSPLQPPGPLPAPSASAVRAPASAQRIDPLPEALRRLLQHDGTALAMFGLDRTIRELSRPMLDLLGASSTADVAPGSTFEGVLRSFLDHVPADLFRSGNHVWNGRVDHRDAAGNQQVFRATVSSFHDAAAPGGGGLSLLMHDITAPNERMRALVHRATHDPLTRLPNRDHILHQLSRVVAAQRGRPGHVVAIVLDLDHLEYVNDAFGHAAGDRLLVSSARRLEQAVRPADDVARIGGDQFLAIAGGVTDDAAALELADRARRALTGHLRIGDLDVGFSVSAGVALTDTDLLELDDDAAASMLVSNADTAMYQSKRSGRGRCTLFTSQMRSMARERSNIANALARAVTDDELTVDYQPIRSAVSGAAVAVGAVERWSHPVIGAVDATRVIELAEESGTIGRLGEFVLEHALTDLGSWFAAGEVDSTFAVHVHVSRVQLGSSSFVNLVADRLRHHGLEPAQLVLEARESSLRGRDAEVERTIRALRRSGVRVAIDNLGIGAGALTDLSDVRADVLVLDGSLTLPSGSSEADVRLVRAVVLLAHALEMDVVAGQVHDQEQLRRLRAAGCDMLQGSLLGLPTPPDTIDLSASVPI